MRVTHFSISLLLLLSCRINTNLEKVEESKSNSADTIKTISDVHLIENALYSQGRYTGTLPCADCSGIKTTIFLKGDNTYNMSRWFVGKSPPVESSGSIIWNAEGSVITLNVSKSEKKMYKVGENMLTELDKSGNEIMGVLADNYQLNKAHADTEIENIYWELVELHGQKIDLDPIQRKAYFILNSGQGQVSGSLTCNSLSGTYQLKSDMRISFGKISRTLVLCQDMSIEREFHDIFGEVDNYNLQDDMLTLNNGKKFPLAVFKAVKQ